MKHKSVSRFFDQSKSAKIASLFAIFLIGLALVDHIIFRKSAEATKVSESESRSPRTRLQEPRGDPALSPAHGKRFRADHSSSMTREALSEYLRAPRFLTSSEITTLIEQYGFEEIISYLSSLPDQEEYHQYHKGNYTSLRSHLAHLLLSSSIDEFVEAIRILPELIMGMGPRLQALDLVYPESRLLERTREAGVGYGPIFIDHMFFITLYDHTGSMAEVVKLVGTTRDDQRALVKSLRQVSIDSLPSRRSDDGIVLFDFLENVKTEDPLFYKQYGAEEALKPWLTTD